MFDRVEEDRGRELIVLSLASWGVRPGGMEVEIRSPVTKAVPLSKQIAVETTLRCRDESIEGSKGNKASSCVYSLLQL